MTPVDGGHLVHAVQVHAVKVLLSALVVRLHLTAGLGAVLVLQLLPRDPSG